MNREKIEARLDEIESRHPKLQINALGKKDLAEIRWLATTMREMLAENKRLREENNQVRNDLLDLVEEQKDSALLKRLEAMEKVFWEIRKEAGDWQRTTETMTNKTGKPAITINAVYQMADRILKEGG